MKIRINKTENSETKPTNYFFVTDLSGSMWGSIRQLKETLLSVKELLSPKDTISLAYFASSGDFDWIIKGASPSNGLDTIIEQKIYARGLTCYTEVLESLKTVVGDVSMLTGTDNNVFYFLSDGYPNHNSPESKILSLCNDLKDQFLIKRVVGYSGYYNRPLLLEMSETIDGTFNHVSDFTDMRQNYQSFVSTKKKFKKVNLDKKYDVVYQIVKDDILLLGQDDNNEIYAIESDETSELIAMNYDEIEELKESDLRDANFLYSLCFVLSQKNKVNLAIYLLRSAKDYFNAKLARKAFTVTQKGNLENTFKSYALKGGLVDQEEENESIPLQVFVEEIKQGLGNVQINLEESKYKTISKKQSGKPIVSFESCSPLRTVVDIVGNENRANLSLLTVGEVNVTDVLDDELRERIDTYNQTADKKIEFPIKAENYKNYSFVADGDFNFEKIALKNKKTGVDKFLIPDVDLDIFEENQEDVDIKDFVRLYKNLIKEKANASALRFYIKENSDQKHFEDLRTEYGSEGAKILEDLGFDYKMRFAPKFNKDDEEFVPVEDRDYIPFLEISAYLDGASSINAKKSYQKYEKGGKQNAGDKILWPLFETYDKKKEELGKEDFVAYCQKTLDSVEDIVSMFASRVSRLKFYLMSTNSWFNGVEKSDKFTYDDLVVKVKTTKEYV